MPGFAEVTATLNPEQRSAATRLWKSQDSALQLIAGAGSGKTTTLVAATFGAIEAGFQAERIAVITFSRRAAHELRERFVKYNFTVGYCGTMHALAWRLLRESGSKQKILLHAVQARGRIARALFPGFAHIPEHVLLSGGFLSDAEEKQLDDTYTEKLKQTNQIDFDGMIAQATRLGAGAGRFDVLLVDEFQDTSPDQIAFIRSLAPQKLFAVGDDWQSIYRFRGADVAISQDFPKHFTGAARAYLVKNYRSGKSIVRLGNRTIRESKGYVKKKLAATHPTFHKPVLFFAPDTESPEKAWNHFLEKMPLKFGFLNSQKLHILVRTNSIRLLLEKQKPENVEILTIHKSKGLEFDNVIVFGIAEHLLPHRDNDFDEEVRILYVALTRARRFLGFVGWEKESGTGRSAFLPLLMRQCKLVYLRS